MPKPVPDPVPPYWNMSAYCAFHQGSGHLTDEIKKNGIIKHKIFDLIDKRKMTVPQEDAPSNPNKNVGIFKDPLPQHGSVCCFHNPRCLISTIKSNPCHCRRRLPFKKKKRRAFSL
jgi:hypothetical protein